MKIISNPPLSQRQLREMCPLLPVDIPITAVQGYTYVISDDDLKQFIKPEYREAFYEALGINTRISEGVYLCDVENAFARMRVKELYWD